MRAKREQLKRVLRTVIREQFELLTFRDSEFLAAVESYADKWAESMNDNARISADVWDPHKIGNARKQLVKQILAGTERAILDARRAIKER